MPRHQPWWLVVDAIARHEEVTWPIFRGGLFTYFPIYVWCFVLFDLGVLLLKGID